MSTSDTTRRARWEYSESRRMTDTDGVRTVAMGHADRMGAEGWELVAAFPDGRWTQFWWKREVTNDAR